MAGMSLDQRTGKYLVNFRYGGQKFLVSSKTKDQGTARRFKSRIEGTLQLMERGHITMPPDADARLFITSGGKLTDKPKLAPVCTL
jgi:PleD family two-component response regulator